jgi:hypothetical protein
VLTGGGTALPVTALRRDNKHGEATMRGILLWAVGIPIPVIILLYLFHVI